MADHRLEEGQILYDNNYFNGSFYLSGYAIEFGLKAIICKNLGVDIFQSGTVSGDHIKSFQVHNLPALILLSGLKPELDALKATDQEFAKIWNKISGWKEDRRYDYGCSQQTAAEFLVHVRNFLTWIKTHW